MIVGEPRLGDLVVVTSPAPRGEKSGAPCLVLDVEASGWYHVRWSNGWQTWMPAAQLAVVSRA